MKQEAGKKNKKWLWLVIALIALLAAAGVVLALLLPGQQQAGPESVDAELYWNVDRALYTQNAEVAGMSTREAAADGSFYVRFAHDGQQLELQVMDKQLVNFIDNMDVMGLVFDAEGVVVDAVAPETVATKTAIDFYVRSVDESSAVLNSSIAMNGMELTIAITENTGSYDVSQDAEMVGQVSQMQVFDRVSVWSDADGAATHIYITSHPADAELYWRVERCLDTETGETTRVPDENGVYTILFSHKGELVELKCRDKALVNELDTQAVLQGQYALVFDEEGYIVDTVDVSMALRGTYFASDYHVTGIDGNRINLTKLSAGNEQGNTKSITLSTDCQIFQCCQHGCYDHNCGEVVDSLKLYDRVNIYSDLDGNAIVIFVTRRMVDTPMFYNLVPQYGGEAKGSTREKQGGYYMFEMLSDGKVLTLKTADKAIADAIDGRSNRCSGLVLEGNIITRAYDPSCVFGGIALGNRSPLSAMSGSVITVSDPYSGGSWNAVLSPDCKIYNAITGVYGKAPGGEMDLQVGDIVTTFRNYQDEIVLVFVTARPVQGAKIYYNLDRMYNAEQQQTRREPNSDGWYVFKMACEGKQVEVKTQSKALATFIDSQNAPLVGLKVSKDGTVTSAYEVTIALQNAIKTCNYHYVKNLDQKAGTFSTYYLENNEKKNSSVPYQTIAKNCVIYNVSTAYENYRGEVSKLKDGDQIQAIQDVVSGEIIMIFIMNRDPISGFNTYNAHCSHCGKTVTWHPYGGAVIVEEDIHYYACSPYVLRQGIIGKEDDGKTYDVVIDLKGKTVTGMGRAFLVYDKLTILDSVGGGKVAGTTPSGDAATNGSTVMVISGGELNLMGGELTLSDKSTLFGTYGGVLFLGADSVVNMSGGSIRGGTSTDRGGNVYIVGGTFNMSGGTIAGGTAPTGENMFITPDSTLNLSGGTIDGGIHMLGISNVILSGKPVIGGKGLKVPGGVTLNVGKLTKGASVVLEGDGIFTEALTDPASYLPYFKAAKAGDTIVVEGSALSYAKERLDYNSINNGNLSFAPGTTNAKCPVCNKTVTWTALDGSAAITLSEGGHYYLASDVTYSGSEDPFITGPEVNKTACVHLNGNNITATANRAIEGKAGVLNIMGNGTVSGSYNDHRLFGATLNMNGADGMLNLIGGTYTKSEACNVSSVLLIRNGNVSMYGGAQIVGANDSGKCANVVVFNRSFTLYGGKISGGSGNQLAVNNWSTAISGIANIHGGEILGTVVITGADTKHGVFNMDGGTVTGYLHLSRYVDSLIAGGSVSGTVNIDTNATNDNSSVTLSGTPVITGTGLVIPKGYKLTLGQLSKDASVNLNANGVFTLANDNAEQYASCFIPADGYEILIKDGALLCQQEGAVEEPEQPDNGFVLDPDGDGTAKCPVCQKDVQWTALSDAIGDKCVDGGHYYLAADQTALYQYMTIVDKTVCLHLNNKNLTYASRMFVAGTKGVLNVMGEGSVTSTGTSTSTGTLTGTITVNGGTVNLYGGTYASTAAGIPALKLMGSNNSKMNLYPGVVIQAGSGVVAEKGTLTVDGATVNSSIQLTAAAMNLGGNAKVDLIQVASTAKLTVKADYIGTASASFAGFAGGTVPSTNGACEGQYTGTLTLDTPDGAPILGKEGALVADVVIENVQVLKGQKITAAANAMTFPTDKTESTQTCPVCGTEVVWKPLGAQLGEVKDGAYHHYYISQDFTSQYQLITLTSGTVCLHMNGHNVDVESRIFITNGDLNIMGSGKLTGLGTSGVQTGALTVGNNAVASLYGCTVTSVAESGTPAIRLVNGDGAKVDVYAGTVIGGEKGKCTGANVVVEKGSFNMYGGTVQNGTGFTSDGMRKGGNVFLYTGTSLNMHAGVITGGSAELGGNICVTGAAVSILDSAVISGGESTSHGGNLHMIGTCVLATSGKITGGKTTGEAAHGGNISLTEGCVLVVNGGEITGGIAAGQGGNLRCWNATVTMTGGVISGGDSMANINDNVWAAGSTTMTMLGGTVKGTDGTTANGTAIFLGQKAVLYLGGDATVSRDDGVPAGNIYVSSTATEIASLRVLNNWTGTASVRWKNEYLAGATVDTDCGSCGVLTDGVFTAGGSYTGKLIYEPDRSCVTIGEDGVLKIAAAE